MYAKNRNRFSFFLHPGFDSVLDCVLIDSNCFSPSCPLEVITDVAEHDKVTGKEGGSILQT